MKMNGFPILKKKEEDALFSVQVQKQQLVMLKLSCQMLGLSFSRRLPFLPRVVEFHNREKPLRSLTHEITVRRSASPSSEFHIIFPQNRACRSE
jgi:hypothetical protein